MEIDAAPFPLAADKPKVNTTFAFISMVADPAFVLLKNQEPEFAPGYFISLPKLNEFIQPLLKFKADPRQQYWYVNAKQPCLVYLGEHAQWDSVMSALLQLNLPSSAVAGVVGFSQAAELLRTAESCLQEYRAITPSK